jgi:hypothetical protein
MTKEQMIEIILNEERELYSTYRESLDAFGTNDAATTHAITRWVVIANLLQTLLIKLFLLIMKLRRNPGVF